MVGIVLVSHSARLAAGVHELVAQMVQDRVPVAVAGGIDDPQNPIGTDPMRVLSAIESVYSEDGVVVLMDLGSALLSAEMALEFLSPEQQAQVHLCPAPLVEGALAAAVQASLGSSVAEVLQEARSALAVKEAQLGVAPAHTVDAEGAGPSAKGDVPDAEARSAAFTIENRQGLHARPAAQFVRTAGAFDAVVFVQKDDRRVNARSINQVATLGVRQGDVITITAEGAEAEAVLAALAGLIDARFGEDDVPETTLQQSVPAATADATDRNRWHGIPVAPGVAVGPVAHYRPQVPEIAFERTADPEAEWNRMQGAVRAAATELEAILDSARTRLGTDHATILEAHILILQDPMLLEAVEARIQAERLNAAAAWKLETDALAASYRALEDPYMQARAADIQDVARRVLGHMLTGKLPALHFSQPVVLVAVDLLPSDAAVLDAEQVLGICTSAGGATSHSAILARALGIPAVAGLGDIVQELPEGQTIGLDGDRGFVWPEPSAQEIQFLEERRREWRADRLHSQAAARRPAATRDGHRIETFANIGRPVEVAAALENGAEGVGLFRTEFLFLDRATPPDEEEQLAAYREAATMLGDHPLIIRTLDIGGDKPIPYLDQPKEENPFLGLRGIRYCLQHMGLFKTQLRAVLRASADHQLKLMFPMIGTPAELRAAHAVVREIQDELREAGVPYGDELPIGIMIEVPSAVAVADRLAAEADFFSIGTNDLTQYVMAADRGNAGVAALADAFQPAVLQMIAQATAAAGRAGIPVGMCGELAGNPLATPLLVGLGLHELSMSAPSIPAVKAALGTVAMDQAKEIARMALQLDDAAAVAAFLKASQFQLQQSTATA